MSGTLTNRERKEIIGNKIKAHEARIQASIDACNDKRTKKRIDRQERIKQNEKVISIEMKNLNKSSVIIFAKIDDEIVILTILDFNLLKSDYSVGMKHHIMYGLSDYHKLTMMASYTFRGKRLDKHYSTYTVFTEDGIHFNILNTDGNVLFSFETLIQYESLAGRSISDVNFDQFLYEPHKCASDKDTAMFHTELDRLIEADRQNIERNPELRQGYFPYHRGL